MAGARVAHPESDHICVLPFIEGAEKSVTVQKNAAGIASGGALSWQRSRSYSAATCGPSIAASRHWPSPVLPGSRGRVRWRLAQPRDRAARSRRDEAAHDHVLLEAFERIDLAVDGGVGEDARRLLERCGREHRARLQRRLGDAEQDRPAYRGLAAEIDRLLVGLVISSRSTCSPVSSVVSAPSVISIFCIIWRNDHSMCLSLIFTPCSR